MLMDEEIRRVDDSLTQCSTPATINNIIHSQCCAKQCLQCISPNHSSGDLSQSFKIVQQCRAQIECRNSDEQKVFLRSILTACTSGLCSDTDRNKRFKYHIGFQLHGIQPIEVCYTAFMNVYNVTDYRIKLLRSEIKLGNADSSSNFSDRTSADPISIKRLKTGKSEALQTSMSAAEVAMMELPNGDLSLKAHAWMEVYFPMVGDSMPNSIEIHLDPVDKLEIWKEFERDSIFVLLESDYLSYPRFLELWTTCFPHVKIREYKAVTGKCTACAVLSEMRRKHLVVRYRQLVNDLHAIHRSAFMSEKRVYYEKIIRSCQDSVRYMSMISDGMAQNHTKLPWMGNLKDFPSYLPQHLQGVLEHGQVMTIYRTFHNVAEDTNMAIHSFLLQIESRMNANHGTLPDTLFYQMDGGAENANQFTLAICELLIAKKVFKHIYLTRLPVGHTHEDIDAKFGHIWKGVRDKHLLTPQAYRSCLIAILGKGKLATTIHDIFVVPDYKALLAPCIDRHLSSWTKQHNTQLAWRFTSVQRCTDYPLGVKTHYRAFASDEYFEIIVDPRDTNPIGYQAVKTHCTWKPEQSAHNRADGMYILHHFPSDMISPAEFVPGSRALLDCTIKRFKEIYHKNSAAVDQWEEFGRHAPSSDDVYEYIQRGGQFYVPLHDRLFGHLDVSQSHRPSSGETDRNSSTISASPFANGGTTETEPMLQVRATDSVIWGNRGSAMPRIDPRMVITDSTLSDEEQRRAIAMAPQNYDKLDGKTLKSFCKARGLVQSGPVVDVRRRLKEYDAECARTVQAARVVYGNNSGIAHAVAAVAQAETETRRALHSSLRLGMQLDDAIQEANLFDL